MPDMTPAPEAEAACAKRAGETARLDMIRVNLRGSALQISAASLLLLWAFADGVTGSGHGLTPWHFAWAALQCVIAAGFLVTARLWPARASGTRFGVSRRSAYVALYFISGLNWGALTWVAIVPGDIFNQVFVMLVIICLSMIYSVRLSACTPVFMAGAIGLFAVAMPNIWVLDNGLSDIMRIAVPAWLALVVAAAARLGAQISDMIETRLREAELVRRLSEANARVEKESASKSAFLANMSHELRTPLNAILGFSDLMREGIFGSLDARYRGYANDIHASGEHLLSLINDLLDIAKIESGHMKLAIEPVEVCDIAPQVIRLLQREADAKRQTLHLSLTGAPVAIMADARAVTQILLNLAGNALKYSQAGSVVCLAVTADARDVVLTVADNGPGIPADKQARLFKPFQRVDNSYLAGDSGTGLGLALVSELAALHGGTAAIESAPGAGTTVTVRLPGAVIPAARAA
ncbi:MAG: HAMP domain-containing sensor histidine kinase [Micropepsaceae bacterium]